MFLEYRLVTVSPSQTRSPDSGLGGVSCQGQGLPCLLTGQVKAPGAGRWPGSWIYPGCGNRRELLNEMASDHALGLFCLSQRMLACVCFLINLETSVDSSAAPSGFLLSSTHFLLSSTHNTHTSESSWFQRMCFIPLLLEDSEDPVRLVSTGGVAGLAFSASLLDHLQPAAPESTPTGPSWEALPSPQELAISKHLQHTPL